MFNNEDEDDNAVGAARYPCMPSLVALQHMRNRLHLAYLGRKLMKWSATATGRELRRLAGEIDAAYQSFAEDLGNAFMLLARGRYFCPDLNKMVLENVPSEPCVTVTSHIKTVSGVRVLQYDVIESDVEPYEHLGIEKGGQKIHEAKVAWFELLKRMVLMLELRTSFVMIDQANRNATKRQNVMHKVVIPRTQATMHYIVVELEEMAREETFRIKIIKKRKARLAKAAEMVKTDEGKICPVCNEVIIEDGQSTGIKSKTDSVLTTCELDILAPPISKETLSYAPSLKAVPSKGISLELPCSRETVAGSAHTSISFVKEDSEILKQLKKLLEEVIGRAKTIDAKEKVDMNSFLRVCKDAKDTIDRISQSKEQTTAKIEGNLRNRLETLKNNLKDVIDLSKNSKNQSVLTSGMQSFIKTCESIGEKLGIYRKQVEDKDKLVEQLQETISLSKVAKKDGMIDDNIDEFVECCENLKQVITTKDIEKQPQTLTNLKASISNVIDLLKDLKAKGLASDSTEQFVKACELTKHRIDNAGTQSQVSSSQTTCGKACSCKQGSEICDDCNKLTEPTESIPFVKEPCEYCGEFSINESEQFPCQTCEKVDSKQCNHDSVINKEESVKSAGKSESVPSASKNIELITPTSSTIGYYEKKIKKIVRVTRTVNKDGSVREEIETITIRKMPRDPRDDGNENFDAYIANVNTNIGFTRHAKSEGILRASKQTPNVRRSISFDMVCGSFSDCTFDVVASRNSLCSRPHSSSNSQNNQ